MAKTAWIVTAAAAVVLAGSAAVFMLAPGIGVSLIAAWLAAILLLVGLVTVCLGIARSIVGEASTTRPGYRTIAVTVAVLLASLASAPTAMSVLRGFHGAGEAFFVQTPQLIEAAQAGAAAGPQAELSSTSDAAGTTSGSEERSVGAKAQALQSLFGCVTAGSCGPEANSGSSLRQHIASALWFLIVLISVLLVARALGEARWAFILKSGHVEPETSKGRATKLANVMSYPTWIAFVIYALILAPATYLAIGSLLYLQTDRSAPVASEFARALDRDEQTALEALRSVTLDLDRLRLDLRRWRGQDALLDRLAAGGPDDPAAGGTAAAVAGAPVAASPEGAGDRGSPGAESSASGSPESTQPASTVVDPPWLRAALGAVDAGRVLNEELVVGRTRYESRALQLAQGFRRRAVGSDLDDYRALLSADYQRAIQTLRTDARPCLEALARLQVQAARTPSDEEAPALNQRILDTSEPCRRTLTFPQPRSLQSILAGEEPGCKSSLSCAISDDARLPESLFTWLADSSDEAVLVAGLVGFGLFGAAIRMMGRLDEPTVTEAEVAEAEAAAQAAQALYRQGRSNLEQRRREGLHAAASLRARQALNEQAAEDPAASETIAAGRTADEALLRAKTAVDTAFARYQRLRQAHLGERSDIVIERLTATGDREYTVSGAAARVFVQGLGAAFTVFLAGQAAANIVAENGRIATYSLLASCFVGAVFAEEIWRWAKRRLPRADEDFQFRRAGDPAAGSTPVSGLPGSPRGTASTTTSTVTTPADVGPLPGGATPTI